MRTFLVAAAALGVVLTPGVALADSYPTDHATPAPAVAPKPADYPYPEFSLCYPVTPVSPTLGRKDCYLYVSKTGVLVPGSGAVSVFPQNNPLVAPTFEPVAPITAAPAHEAPATRPPLAERNVGSSAPSTALSAPTSQPTPQPAAAPTTAPETSAPAAETVAGGDVYQPAGHSNAVPLTVAGIAAVILLLALAWRPRRR